MNTMITSTHFTYPRVRIATTVLGVLISSFAAVCGAADSIDAPRAIVRYADLDISSPQGAATLYNRIRSASEALCAPLYSRDLGSKFRAEEVCAAGDRGRRGEGQSAWIVRFVRGEVPRAAARKTSRRRSALARVVQRGRESSHPPGPASLILASSGVAPRMSIELIESAP